MPHTRRHSRTPFWMVALVCCCLLNLTGCSLFVMAGKMIQGDPVVDAEFDKYYGKSLEKSGKKVAVLVSTPETVKSEFSSLDIDLAADISRKLALHHIDVIENHRIAKWIDDNGGDLDLKELGSEIEADLVIRVNFNHFDYREEASSDLFRGRANGSVAVYELVREGDTGGIFEQGPKSKSAAEKKKANEDEENSKDTKHHKSKKRGSSKPQLKVLSIRRICDRSFDSLYPTLQPVSITQMQPETFRRKFLDRIGDELARLFYRHKPGTDI